MLLKEEKNNQNSIFGEDILRHCTPLGKGDFPALPRDGMAKLKNVLQDQFSVFRRNPAEFEELWESAVIAIQHL